MSSWGVQSPHLGHLIKFISPLQLICNIPTLKLFPNAIYGQFPAWLPSLSLWRGGIVIRMSAEFRPFFPPSAILRAAVNCREFSGIATSRLTTSSQAFVSSRHLSRPLCWTPPPHQTRLTNGDEQIDNDCWKVGQTDRARDGLKGKSSD